MLFDYLRENPDVLFKGLAGIAILIIILVVFLDWRYGILDDPKPQHFKNDN